MDDTQLRLGRCFSAVFPTLSEDRVRQAHPSTVEGWDSVASVTLFATVEEEFGIELDVQDLKDLLSYEQLLTYLRQKLGKNGQ